MKSQSPWVETKLQLTKEQERALRDYASLVTRPERLPGLKREPVAAGVQALICDMIEFEQEYCDGFIVLRARLVWEG